MEVALQRDVRLYSIILPKSTDFPYAQKIRSGCINNDLTDFHLRKILIRFFSFQLDSARLISITLTDNSSMQSHQPEE